MALRHLQLMLTNQTLHDDPAGFGHEVGAMTGSQIQTILRAAREIESIDTIHCIGGEPFLNYPVLMQAVHGSTANGYKTIVLTNAFWATSVENARAWLEPMRYALGELRLRGVVTPHNSLMEGRIENACEAADQLGIRVGKISMVQSLPPVKRDLSRPEMLLGQAQLQPWHSFTTCPYRNLEDPEYLTIDPAGYVQLCEGVAIGNLFQKPLRAIWDAYIPALHPVAGVLLRGGPAALVAYYALEVDDLYEDACDLCREARRQLQDLLPQMIIPTVSEPDAL